MADLINNGILWTKDAFAFQSFVESIISTEEEGKALWYIIQNQHIYKDNVQIPTGSFRWNAHIIASVVGGSYMDYYCSSQRSGDFSLEVQQKIEEKLKSLHYQLIDVD